MTAPTLTTERLTLRMPMLADFEAYRAFYADAESSGFYGGPLRPDQAFRVLANDVGHWHLKGYGKWVLERRDSKEVAGGCGLVHPNSWPSAELTWWLAKDHRGIGLAQEASQSVISFAYGTLGWDTVETHMRDENIAARKLAERLGGRFVRRANFPDGFERDVLAFPKPADEVQT